MANTWVCNSVHTVKCTCLRKVPSNETRDMQCIGGHWSGRIACFDARVNPQTGDRVEVCGVWYVVQNNLLIWEPLT